MTNMPPIMGVAGDQQASLLATACFRPGQTKNTYGTGCFMLMNTGDEIVESKNGPGLPPSVSLRTAKSAMHSPRGSTPCCWFHHELASQQHGHHLSVSESAQLAASISDNEGCYFVPAFAGLGAPWWTRMPAVSCAV